MPIQIKIAEAAVKIDTAGLLYYGVRKYVYGVPVDDDVRSVIERAVDIFLLGAVEVTRQRVA